MSEDNSNTKPWLILAGTTITAIGGIIVAFIAKPLQPIQPASTPSSMWPATTPLLASPNEPNYDLTGVWKTKGSVLGNATFYVRQDGSTVWWYGHGDNPGSEWGHVLKGTLSGNQINANWADIPVDDKTPQNKGEMTVTVLYNKEEMIANDHHIKYTLELIR